MRITKEQEEIRNEIIERWQQSGLNQKAYCRQEKINYGTFHYWHKQYKKSISHHSESNFVSLTCETSEEQTENSGAEIVFPSGVRIVFRQTPSAVFLQKLIS